MPTIKQVTLKELRKKKKSYYIIEKNKKKMNVIGKHYFKLGTISLDFNKYIKTLGDGTKLTVKTSKILNVINNKNIKIKWRG
jgi:hypothetical protein